MNLLVQINLLLVFILLLLGICKCSKASEPQSQELPVPGKNEEKKGYFRDKILNSFHSFKNFITLPIPSRLSDGPVLYKPYLNFKPPSEMIQYEPVPLQQVGPNSNEPIMGSLEKLKEWKVKKHEKIQEVKEVLLKDEQQQNRLRPTLSPAQLREMELIKRFHMHGVVDTYRPPAIGWGWNEMKHSKKSKQKKSKPKKKKKKPKKKKKKPIKKKKPKKKKKTKKKKGWGSEADLSEPAAPGWKEISYSAHAPAVVPVEFTSAPAIAPVWKESSYTAPPASVFELKSNVSELTTVNVKNNVKPKQTNQKPKKKKQKPDIKSTSPGHNLQNLSGSIPVVGGRTTFKTFKPLYGFVRVEPSTKKVKPPVVKRRPPKPKKSYTIKKEIITKQRGNSRFNALLLEKRILEVPGDSDQIVESNTSNSVEIAESLNKHQQHHRIFSSSEETLNSYEDDEENDEIPLMIQSGHELYFRRMPFIYEEEYDSSVYF